MIDRLADQDRRRIVLVLHAAEYQRLIERDSILIRNAGTGTYQDAGQAARDAIDLGWIELDPNLVDSAGDPLLRLTVDGYAAYRNLRTWCASHPISH